MIKRNSGFTLVEAMITAAIMGGLALVGMQMMKSQTKQTTKASLDSEMLLVTNEIIGILTDPDKCFTTLGGKSAQATAPGSITAINGNRYYVASHPSAPVNGYGNASVQIESYEIEATLTDIADHYSYLIIRYKNKQLLKSAAGTPPTVPRKIKMYVEVDGAYNITKCISLSAAYSEIWKRNEFDMSKIYYAEHVGIGITDPVARLHVNNDVIGGAPATTGTIETNLLTRFEADSAILDQGFLAPGASWLQARSRLDFSLNYGLLLNPNGGNVGIATTAPTLPLHVNGAMGSSAGYGSTMGAGIGIGGGGTSPNMASMVWGDGTGWKLNFGPTIAAAFTPRITFVDTGSVGINITTPLYPLHVVGNTYVQGTVYGTEFAATSDRNAKANIKKLNNAEAFKKVSKLNPVSFIWKHNQTKDMGFIAQEVESIFPEFVQKNAEGNYSLKYNSLTGPIVASIQHLKDENEQLKGQVKALQDENKAILIELKKINSRLERKSGQIIRP